jgi:predicted nuclease of predicted toxin-antitoxin system
VVPELRFLFDQHVNGAALRALRARGVDILHVAEVGLADADDPAVLEYARRDGRIVVTRNYHDFGPLVQALAARAIDFPGVLFLATSVRQSDVGAHVRVVADWIAVATAAGVSPVRGTFGWLR